MTRSAGLRFRQALAKAKPLQIVGTTNAYFALMAEQSGVQALYLSGAGVANASYGLPDLGMTSMNDVLIDAGRITSATELPLLVDIDTGWGGASTLPAPSRNLKRPVLPPCIWKIRCHRNAVVTDPTRPWSAPKRWLTVSRLPWMPAQMRTSSSWLAQTRLRGRLDAGIERAQAYIEAGADMIFAEALTELDQYRRFKAAVNAPILANMTEFGKTELFNKEQLAEAGADMVLYPLSTFRAANLAALKVMQALMADGHQRNVVDTMQTREELYKFLGYHHYETKLDELFSQK